VKIKSIPIDRVIPYARNPRRNEAAVAKVAASIREFGWQQPIVVDAEGVVIVGHTRLAAAKRLGLDVVPVHYSTLLTPAQVQAYRLADNRLHEEASWDEDLLRAELAQLNGLGFDLELAGFDNKELTKLLASAFGGGLTDPDDAPDVPEKPVSQLGDIWRLGVHRLVCGDCTVGSVVSGLLAGAVPNLMVTDPPYGVAYDPDWRNVAERASGKKVGARAIGKVMNDHRADWREAWAMFPGNIAYVWHAGSKCHTVGNSLESCEFVIRTQIVWVKTRHVLSRGHYHQQHEPCFYAVRKNGTGDWQGDRKQSTVWCIEHLKSDTGHGTQKPVECMRRPIENNSEVGGAVYEPFSGSGTTIIAAEMTGRTCYAAELSPAYVDVAVRRWQDFTGKDAVLESSGQTFTQVQGER
jgi:DNA modification methylase